MKWYFRHFYLSWQLCHSLHLPGTAKIPVFPTICLRLPPFNKNCVFLCYHNLSKTPSVIIIPFYFSDHFFTTCRFSKTPAIHNNIHNTLFSTICAKLLDLVLLLASPYHLMALSSGQPIFSLTHCCITPVMLTFISALSPLILAKYLQPLLMLQSLAGNPPLATASTLQSWPCNQPIFSSSGPSSKPAWRWPITSPLCPLPETSPSC